MVRLEQVSPQHYTDADSVAVEASAASLTLM